MTPLEITTSAQPSGTGSASADLPGGDEGVEPSA
jgi:hypothetical protein